MLAPYTPLVSLKAAAIDTETTGLDLATARVIQIAVLPLTGGRIEGEILEALVDPQVPIPAASQRIHGISDGDVRGQPTFAATFPRVDAAFAGRVAIGYNTGFDLSILEKECALAKLPWSRPPALDIRFLARVVTQQFGDDSLEALADWLGVEITDRHTARGDAEAAARIYCKLIPHLRERGVRTLGEAQNASSGVLQRAANLYSSAGAELGGPRYPYAEPVARPDRVFLELDSFPYRHRVSAVMRAPIFADAGLTLDQAAQMMIDNTISALLIPSGSGTGIVTERDLLWSLAEEVRGAPRKTIGEIMSLPLHTVRDDDFVYRAIGRMERLKVRHLAVVGDGEEIIGIVSARTLLRQRATAAIALGDEIDRAPDIEALGLARAKLAAVAQSLVAEDIGARAVAEVISAELRALNARAAVLAEDWMAETGRGAPPCPYALLILGSAGRGESLLSADQDNAIAFARGEPGGAEDQWFAALGAKIAEILDMAGVPYCKGGVMARNPAWRHSVEGWRDAAQGWIRRSRPQDLLDVDIFFDARVVHGDQGIGAQVVEQVWTIASTDAGFLKMLSENARQIPPAFTLWGGLKADETGRLDLKRLGLMPIFTGARVLALKYGARARSTPDRLTAVKGLEGLPESEIDEVIAAHATLFEAILHQQMRDIADGVPPSARVNLAQLTEAERRDLKAALSAARTIADLVGEGLIV